MRSRSIILAAFMACLLTPDAPAQQLSGIEILDNVERNFAGVADYIVDLEVDVNMDRLRMPRMKATMYFKQPDKVHFDAPEFAMIPREGILLNPRLLRNRYDVVFSNVDTLGGMRVLRLQLAAREVSIRIRQMHLYVNPANWTIVKMEMSPFPGRVATFEFDYARQQGNVWMPARLVASFSTADRDTSAALPEFAQEMSPRYNEMRGPLRSGSITVQYGRYRMNTGLSNEIFERKGKE